MYQQDFLMRQIKGIADMIAAIIFRKTEVAYEIQDETNHTETDTLFLNLTQLLDIGKINEAEDLLFDSLDTNNRNHLLLATDFYQRLNAKTDAELKDYGFSRAEVEEGLAEIIAKFGIQI